MSSTMTHLTKSFPKRGDITGSPEQAFHMLDNRDKYYKYLLGGISAGTIVALGTIAPGGSFQYLYAPQIYHDLGGEPISIIGTSSNMIGEFSCIYITLGDFKCFPFVEAAASMSKLLKHTDVTPLLLEHLKFTKDWKSFIDPIRGTFLPNFFIIYIGQEIPQGSISSDDLKTAMAKMGPGYALWVSAVSNAIDNIDDINCIIDAFSEVDNLSLSNFYKKHFCALYDKDTSFPVSGAPYGTITTVPSNAYPVEVEAVKKIFLLVHYGLPQAPATASAVTLQLPRDVKKEVVANDGINKLKLFHICGMINPESTSFGTLSFAPFSKRIDLVMNQPRAGQTGALSNLLCQSLAIAREEDTFNIRSTAVTLGHVSKSMTAHMLSGNLATDEAASLNNKAHAIDPPVFLPQKNPALVNREISRDLHAPSESAMDVLDSHKMKAVTSIGCIGTMQDMGYFTSLCVNSDTVVMGMFFLEGPRPLYPQVLLVFVKIVNSRDWIDWFAKNGGDMPGLHWHLYVYVERIFNLLAGFSKNFGNINVVTGGRLT
jgi:hypothetical protein